jgi:IstB-like ATP binding protein
MYITGAFLDRLTHHVHILELNGESYRLKQSKARRRRDRGPPTRPLQLPIQKPDSFLKAAAAPATKSRPSPPRRTRHSTPSRKVAWFCYAPLADFYFGVDSPIKLTVRRMGSLQA